MRIRCKFDSLRSVRDSSSSNRSIPVVNVLRSLSAERYCDRSFLQLRPNESHLSWRQRMCGAQSVSVTRRPMIAGHDDPNRVAILILRLHPLLDESLVSGDETWFVSRGVGIDGNVEGVCGCKEVLEFIVIEIDGLPRASPLDEARLEVQRELDKRHNRLTILTFRRQRPPPGHSIRLGPSPLPMGAGLRKVDGSRSQRTPGGGSREACAWCDQRFGRGR